MKCINCDKETGDYKWCSMKCKEKFLLHNYSLSQCVLVFEEEEKRRKPLREEVIKRWKESGLTFSEYLLSLGEFKDE